MKRIQLSKDILSLSEFRANTASIIGQVKKANRPLVITQHGMGSAALLVASDYEKMLDTTELLQEINHARQEIKDGKGVAHKEVMSFLKERLKQL